MDIGQKVRVRRLRDRAPKEVIATLNDVIKGAMQTTAVKERLSAMGVQPITRTNEQFVAEMKSEYEKAGQLAKKLGTYK